MFEHAKAINEIYGIFYSELSSFIAEEMSEDDEMTESVADSIVNRTGKSQKWTKQEDNMLKTLVERVGEKWDQIAAEMPERSDVQCQQRWSKVVNPELIKGPWTKEVSSDIRLQSLISFSIQINSTITGGRQGGGAR